MGNFKESFNNILSPAIREVTKNPGPINVDTLSNGGLLNPEQMKKFLEFVFETSQLLNAVRKDIMARPEKEISGLLFNTHLTRNPGINTGLSQGLKNTEDQYNYLRGHSSFKMNLKAQKFSLANSISEDYLSDNIEQEEAEDTIMKSFAEVFSQDVENALLNGQQINPEENLSTTITANVGAGDATIQVADLTGFPTASGDFGYLVLNDPVTGNRELVGYTGKSAATGAGNFTGCTRGLFDYDAQAATTPSAFLLANASTVAWYRDPLLGAIDGWRYRVVNPATNEPGATLQSGSTINGGNISEKHFFAIREAMPTKYRARFKGQFAWIMHPDMYLAIQNKISNRDTVSALGDMILQGDEFKPFNDPVIESVYMPVNEIMYTIPKNLIWGVFKDVKIKFTDSDRDSIYKDEIFYKIGSRFDAQVERKDAVVRMNEISTTV